MLWRDSLPATNMLLRFLTQRILFSILFVFCFLALIASFPSFYPKTSPFGSFHPQSASPNDGPDELKSGGRCKALSSKSEDILVVVKTGANEIYDKLPTQLLTALECYTDLLVFSDLDQRIGPYRIHDALDNVTEAAKLHNPVFDYYRSVQEYQQYGQDIGLLRKTGQAAWNLDKYKFLHMLEKSWKMKPGRKWYIFIEADTYLVRSNLLLWLDRLDPSKPLYLGSPTYYNGEAFAHGGSGIILSGAAMSRFADGDPGVAARYDEAMKDEIYGDYMLMKALRDKGVEFSNRWPMLQAEKPATIPFGPGPDNGVRHWCQPIVTMHHITPNEASIIWGFERQRPDITVRSTSHDSSWG